MGKIELLAPAGSMDKLKMAFLYGVDADIAEVNEIFRKAFQIFIVREDIDRDVNPLAQRMGVVDGFFQFFIGKVVAERPKAEGFSA